MPDGAVMHAWRRHQRQKQQQEEADQKYVIPDLYTRTQRGEEEDDDEDFSSFFKVRSLTMPMLCSPPLASSAKF